MRKLVTTLTLVAIVLTSLSSTAFAATFVYIGRDSTRVSWYLDRDTAHRYRADRQYTCDLKIDGRVTHVAINYVNRTYAKRYGDGSWSAWIPIKRDMMMDSVLSYLQNQSWGYSATAP